ncbi:hypothetical protein [Actinomadura sp. WMMB 499]|uniref:hypothetical protein n=1 Tax=Actinomadura sp. WMMB 499 TaxID=1219491 RepID=UPI0012470F79|nr:hypothetical protein [Actinomadura sp. WMMB 499]QFG20034.1 hypothetical protein F7P10_01475 [Actinomadura sp. WMMB 499]
MNGRRQRRVCEVCATAEHERLKGLTLQIPLPGGHVPHHSRSGPWTDVEYGARAPLAARVLIHLEVES